MVSISWHLHNIVIEARPVHHNSPETWSLEVSTLKVFHSVQLAQITLFAHLRLQKAEQLFCFLKIIFALVRTNQASPFWLAEWLVNIEYIRKRQKVHAQRRTTLTWKYIRAHVCTYRAVHLHVYVPLHTQNVARALLFRWIQESSEKCGQAYRSSVK